MDETSAINLPNADNEEGRPWSLGRIQTVYRGEHLSYYELVYYNKETKREKVYEICSRSGSKSASAPPTLKKTELGLNKPNGVVMCVFDKNKEHILVTKEFRMGVNNWVYSFPAGLIDEGESAAEAARRELREETGLHLVEVIDVLPTSFADVSATDDSSVLIVCTADGEIRDSDNIMEPISSRWYTKEDAKMLLKEVDSALISSKLQYFLYPFCHM